MKALLSRCAFRRSIGLVVDEDRVAVSVVATTPLGRLQVFHEVKHCGERTPQSVLEELLGPWIKTAQAGKAKLGSRVQLGLPESQVFQAIVPITNANRDAAPQAYFLEAVQATNVRAEDRMIDMLKVEVGKNAVACVAASPRGAIIAAMDMMEGIGTRVGLAEPAPSALYRAGVFYQKPPRGSKLVARFFLGTGRAIGVLAAGERPLFWHTFDLPAGEEGTAILAANSTLWMLGRNSRISQPIDTVIVHGRPDLKLGHDAETFHQRTGARLLRCPVPDHDAATAALGAALANPATDDEGLDLARTLKPAFSIRDIFPWGELILHGILVGAVSLFLVVTAAETHARLNQVRTQLRSFSWLKNQDQAKLETERKGLQERLKVMEAFRGNSVGWSVLLRTVAAAVPESTTIKGLSGEAEVESAGKSAAAKPKKQLIVNFATPMADDGSVPREIDGFLAALRADPALHRHFPLIEVSGLRAIPSKRGERPFASYSVVCLPKADTNKPAPGR
jgi:hypothetical protein